MGAIKNITVGDYSKIKKPAMMNIAANIFNIVPFALSIEAVNLIFRLSSGVAMPKDKIALWVIAAAMLLYMTVMAYFEKLSYRSAFTGAYNVSAEGRVKLAEHLRRLPLGFLSKYDPADLSSMLITDFAMAETGLSHHLPQLIGALVMPLLAFLGLVWIDWRMSMAMFAALPIAILIMFLAVKVQNKLSKAQIQAKLSAAARIEEYLQGLRIIKAYNMEGEKFSRLKSAYLALKTSSIKQEALLGPFILLSIAVVRAGLTFMILLGVYLISQSDLSVMNFVMFLVIGARVFDPLTKALTNFAEFRYFSIAGGRILSLMDAKEQEGTEELPQENSLNTEEKTKNPHRNLIEFKDVSFSYNDKEVLSRINLKFTENTLTALVGKSGSGKSTVMKLIARFYDCNNGAVLYQGKNLKTLNPEAFMRNISMVFQDVYLFKDTVRNNLLFAKPDADDEELISVCKKAQCHNFIMNLPNGYDTMVGEGGQTLSGGEKQRISIARAMLKDAKIILLDEATASLDAENEFWVQQAINNLIKDKTVIVIAHRLNTIVAADNIAVLDDGRITEQGTHQELIKNNKLYNKLWQMQMSDNETDE
ncbi:MAG: ABC transporter ATP-binding protein [Bacteroidales bacterium]|nr:ABC transporter ATP-binding protein [Bacteroidales bacterium]